MKDFKAGQGRSPDTEPGPRQEKQAYAFGITNDMLRVRVEMTGVRGGLPAFQYETLGAEMIDRPVLIRKNECEAGQNVSE